MKRIHLILLILFALPTMWCHAQTEANASGKWRVESGKWAAADSWALLDSLVVDGRFATARPIAERAWRQAQAEGNGSDRLLAAFYITAIDYAYDKYPADSAITRYTALTHSLQGTDRAVAYAFLLQTYGQVYRKHTYTIDRNSSSDDPSLHYLLWHRRRMEDTMMVCVDGIAACADVLRKTGPDAYRRMFRRDSLTPPPIDSSLLGLLVQALLDVDGLDMDFRGQVLRRVSALYADAPADMALWLDLQRPAFLPSDSLYAAALDSLDAHYSGQWPVVSDQCATQSNRVSPLDTSHWTLATPHTSHLSPSMRALLNYRRASAYSVMKREVVAEQLCLETERLYPGTYGARCCGQLRKRICQQEYSIRYSQTESSRSSRLAVVEARNTTLLHMRLVRQDSLPYSRSKFNRDTLLQVGAVAEWDQPLPDPGDHLMHNYLVALPAVAQGDYYLVAHTDSAMCFEKYQSADAVFITYGMPAAAGKKTQLWPSSGHLVDRLTGKPLAGRKMTLHGEGGITGKGRTLHCRTDKKGYFHFPVSSWRYRFVKYDELSADVDGYEFFYGESGYYWGSVESFLRDYNTTSHHLNLVMTDRPVYRLGDTVQFVCVAYDQRVSGSEWTQRIRPAKKVRLNAVFRHSNSNYSDTMYLTTDSQGRCWGSFVVPADGQNGGYTIHLSSDDDKYYAYKYINVEAYKPPHFMVTLSSAELGVDTVPVRRMGQPVTIYGMAASYSGAPMTGARVRWEVSRERMLDPFQWNTMADEYPYCDSLTVNDDGTFQFTFTPTPDERDTSRYTTYFFTAHARVTDADGELHECQLSLRVSGADGYCQFASINQAILTYHYNNFDHQPLEGQVHVTLQQLRQPDTLRFLDQRLMAEYPDARWVGSEADFRRQFPHLAFTPDEADPRRWPVVATRLDTITSERSIALGDLPSGMYRVVFEMPDGMRHDTVVNHVVPGGRVTGTDLVWLRTTPHTAYWFNITCSVGDTVRIEMGSPYGDQPLYYRVANVAKTYKQGMLMLDSSSTSVLAIPVTKAMMRDGCMVSLTAVRDGRAFQRVFELDVLHPELQCNIQTETFRDRLQPGQHEQWRLRITGADSMGLAANLCMTMYDKSLEQYGRLDFGFNPWYRRIDNLRTEIGMPETQYGRFSPAAVPFNVYTLGYQPQLGYTLWALDSWYKQIAMRYGPGTLTGTITDAKTGEELPFVNVVLKYGGKVMKTAVTDFDGRFVIQSLPTGSYELEISYVGYGRCIYRVDVKGAGVTVCDIKLSPMATTLDCVEILEAQVPCIEIGTPESGMMINSDDIQRMPGNSVESIVATVGGIGYSDGTGANKRAAANAPKSAIAEILSPFSFNEGTDQFSILNSQFSIRKNLSTLAFFKPALRSGKDGSVTVDFTMPDALTQWSLKAFAWTDDYAIGTIDRTVQTQKELMVQPQMPRFLRQGDTVELRAKVSNLTDSTLTVEVGFEVGKGARRDSITSSSSITSMSSISRNITVAPHTSGIASFMVPVPVGERVGVMPYKVVARSAHHSDGESGLLPVLSDKERVTTSRLLYIAGSTDGSEVRRTYTFPACRPGDSLDIAFTARPMDYAFAALPHFKRHRMPGSIYQANSAFVDHIASLDPTASEKEREMAVSRVRSQLHDLLQAQQSDGGWSWMPKGREASLYVTEAVLQRLAACPSLAGGSYYRRYYKKAIDYIDRQLVELYKRDTATQFSIFNFQFSILYTRSLWLDVKPLAECDSLTRQAYDFYMKKWSVVSGQWSVGGDQWSVRNQGLLALTLLHMGDTAEAVRLATRIRERAHVADTLGMYWPVASAQWPLVGREWKVEDAALMVEVMADVLHDWDAVGRIQQWILSYRQGTTWRTDVATASAIAALMRTPSGLTSPDTSRTATMTIKENGSTLTVELRSTSPFPAWGAVFYSHDTPIDSIGTDGTGITLRRTLSTVAKDGSLTFVQPGQMLHVGDRVRVHIDIYCERDLDRIVLHDQRASGFEPVSTKSGWRWNDGLWYYVDIRDEAADCYIDRLEEGHYYVEYDLWVRHAGTFAGGICTLQSVYAPEFRAHTGSQPIHSHFADQ